MMHPILRRKSVLCLVSLAIFAVGTQTEVVAQKKTGESATGLPTPKPGAAGPFIDVAQVRARETRMCALHESGVFWCWGRMHADHLAPEELFPAPVEAPVKFKSIVEGGYGLCGLSTKGELWCRQSDKWERVGMHTWKSLYLGSRGVAGVQSDGTLWAAYSEVQKVERVGERKDWARVFNVGQPLAAVTTGNEVWVPGPYVESEQRKDPAVMKDRVCVPSSGGCSAYLMLLSKGKAVHNVVRTEGDASSQYCVLHTSATMTCTPQQHEPAYASPKLPQPWKDFDLQGDLRCALDEKGKISCWAWHDTGGMLVGYLSAALGKPLVGPPVEVDGGGKWTRLKVFHESVCALRADGTLWCLGGNNWGQLGNGHAGDLWMRSTMGQVGKFAQPGSSPPAPPLGEKPSLSSKDVTQRVRLCSPLLKECKGDGDMLFHIKSDKTGSTYVQGRVQSNGANPESLQCMAQALTTCGWGRGSVGFIQLRLQGDKLSEYTQGILYPLAPGGDRPFDQPKTVAPSPPLYTEQPGSCALFVPESASDHWEVTLSAPAGARLCTNHEDAEGIGAVRYDLVSADGRQWLGQWSLVDRKVHGTVRLWDDQGRMLVDETYDRGKPVGLQRRWDITGGRTVDCQYEKGRPRGLCRKWKEALYTDEEADGKPGTLLSEKNYAADGAPTGVHREWSVHGNILAEIHYAARWEDVYGRRRTRSTAKVSERIYGLPDGKFVHHQLQYDKNEVESSTLHDRFDQPLLPLVPCEQTVKLMPGGLINAFRRGDGDWRPHFGEDRASDLLDGAYDVKVDGAGNSKRMTVSGKPGSYLQGDVWLVQSGEKNTDGWQTESGVSYLHQKTACVEPAAHYKIGKAEPRGKKMQVQAALQFDSEPRGKMAKEGEEVTLVPSTWVVVTYVGCEPVTQELLREPTTVISDDTRSKVGWFIGEETQPRAVGPKWRVTYTKELSAELRTLKVHLPGAPLPPAECKNSAWWPVAEKRRQGEY